jgi:tetratricopeptide (TPR) repeat protein
MMMRVWLRLLVLAVLATAVVPTAVQAQPAPAAASDKTKSKTAKQYVDAGLAAQNTGDYDTAITFYTKAYELVPHPVLIFNIAQATRLAGRVDEALALYAKYLAADPGGPQAQTARDIVAELKAHKVADSRKAEDARKEDEARKAEDARKEDEARKAEDARKADEARKAEDARQAQAAAATRAAELAPPPAPGRSLRLAGIATGVTGVAALAVGVGFAIHGRSLSSELSRTGAVYDQDKVDAGNRANSIAAAGAIGGAVLIAAGATLYWWGHTKDQRVERVSIAPALSDRMAGFVVSGLLP